LRSKAPARWREQLDSLLGATRVIPFGPAEALAAAQIRAARERSGEGIGPLDTLIAATALSRNATLVTRNLREFGRVRGLKVVDWHD